MGFPVFSPKDRQPANSMGDYLPEAPEKPIEASIHRFADDRQFHTITCRRKIGSGAAAPLLLPILYVKRVFLFPGLALFRRCRLAAAR